MIYLPPDFPKDRPAILVDPRSVRHPWLREDGAVVGAPGIIFEITQVVSIGRLTAFNVVFVPLEYVLG